MPVGVKGITRNTGSLHLTGTSYSFVFRVKDPTTKLLGFREGNGTVSLLETLKASLWDP